MKDARVISRDAIAKADKIVAADPKAIGEDSADITAGKVDDECDLMSFRNRRGRVSSDWSWNERSEP